MAKPAPSLAVIVQFVSFGAMLLSLLTALPPPPARRLPLTVVFVIRNSLSMKMPPSVWPTLPLTVLSVITPKPSVPK